MGDLLKFITCGSVDDGKSTLIGHILYDSKLLYTDQEQALLLDSQVGSRGGAIDYSLLLDGLMAEREQGITIDVAYRYFTTDVRSFIVADTPGHEEYTRNMAVGASFADLAIILMDATKGVLIQTRRHARICAMMGIRYFIFAVNKMDLIDYRQTPFDAIAAQIHELSEELSLENTVIIPISATEGDNVTKKSSRMSWYEGSTLLNYLETVDISGCTDERGFYMPVQRVCRPNHTFRGFQGQIESGHIGVGDQLTAMPSQEKAVVKNIFISDSRADEAHEGQPVTIQLDREVDVSRGCVLEKDADLKIVKSFGAALLWMDDVPLSPGKEYWIKIGTKLIPGVVSDIRYKIDINSGKKLDAFALEKNEIAFCNIMLSQAAIMDLFDTHKEMGELILIDRVTHSTAACGVVRGINSGNEGDTVFDDGIHKISLEIFDEFYYHSGIHMVIRHSPDKAIYRPGDFIPISGESYQYPGDFDILMEEFTVQIRGGKFIGFGLHEEKIPLLNRYGLELVGEVLQPFDKYRRVALWKEDEYESRL
jgi:sulfate adenylyltransferase subunit 1